MSPQFGKDLPVGAIYFCSKNGWNSEEMFLLWLQPDDDPVLLILDNHSSYASSQNL
jgi:hypothetical protein